MPLDTDYWQLQKIYFPQAVETILRETQSHQYDNEQQNANDSLIGHLAHLDRVFNELSGRDRQAVLLVLTQEMDMVASAVLIEALNRSLHQLQRAP